MCPRLHTGYGAVMNEREEQLERFGEAVEKKKQDSEEASEQTRREDRGGAGSAVDGDQSSLYESGRTQDVLDPRDKSAGKGKKTADKWNQ